MLRLRMWMAAVMIATACDSPVEEPATQTPRPPRYVVFGAVRDEQGLPIQGASAEIISTSSFGLRALSNSNGYFSFKDVSGFLLVRVWKDGYDHRTHWLKVDEDSQFEVSLLRVETDSIFLGRTIRSAVDPHASPCDPQWDAEAPCRRLSFMAPATGTLTIGVAWFGGSELDVVIVRSDETYLAFSDLTGFDEAVLEAQVEAGHKYEVRVSSYYDPQVFNLTANLAPAGAR